MFDRFIIRSFNLSMADVDESLGADELEAEFSLKKKKKKSTKTKKTSEENGDVKVESDQNTEKAQLSDKNDFDNAENKNQNIFEIDPPNYEYSLLLNRVVDAIHQNNPELADKKRFTMKPPQLMRGTYLYTWSMGKSISNVSNCFVISWYEKDFMGEFS